jgi:hypothetical protein
LPWLRADRSATIAQGPVTILDLVRARDPQLPAQRLLLQCADHSGLWPRIAGGRHRARDRTAAIERAAFEIDASERLMFAAARFEPAIPYILGTARKVS